MHRGLWMAVIAIIWQSSEFCAHGFSLLTSYMKTKRNMYETEVMSGVFKIEFRMFRFNISQVKAGVSQTLLLLNPIRNRRNCLFHTGYFNMDPSLNWKGIWSSAWILKYGFCSSLLFLFSPCFFLSLTGFRLHEEEFHLYKWGGNGTWGRDSVRLIFEI